jgi:hypothetical protein
LLIALKLCNVAASFRLNLRDLAGKRLELAAPLFVFADIFEDALSGTVVYLSV